MHLLFFDTNIPCALKHVCQILNVVLGHILYHVCLSKLYQLVLFILFRSTALFRLA